MHQKIKTCIKKYHLVEHAYSAAFNISRIIGFIRFPSYNFYFRRLMNHARAGYWSPKIGKMGKGVQIDSGVMLVNPKKVSIGDHSGIGRYTILEGEKGLEIGRYCHIGSFCVLQGGGTLKIGNYVTVGSGCKIYSSTHYYTGRGDALPQEQQEIRATPVVIEKNVHIFVNCVVLPGIKIGEAAIIGANSLVNKDIPPWSIAVGSPARVIKQRPKIDLLEI